MSRFRSLPVFALANLVTVAPAAADTVAVLTVEPQDAPELAAQALTARLREDFAATGHALAPPRDLVEVKLVVCGGEVDAACVARAGAAIGANRVVYGTLRRSGGGFETSLTYLEVASVRVIESATATIPARARMDEEADRLFTRLTSLEAPRTEQPAPRKAKALPVASPPASAPQAAPPGDERPRPSERDRARDAPSAPPRFHRSGVAVDPADRRLQPGTARPGGGWRTAFWAAAGTTLAAMGAATWFTLKTREAEDDKNDAIVRVRQSATRVNDPFIVAGPNENACDEAGAQGIEEITSACSRARRSAMLANVLFGTAALAAVASGFSNYRGYWRVSVAPPPSPSGAAVGFSF